MPAGLRQPTPELAIQLENEGFGFTANAHNLLPD